MIHPSACGVLADDVAVLIHDDLLAIGQGHSIAAIADALDNPCTGQRRLCTSKSFLEFRRNKLFVHGFLLSSLPNGAGVIVQGMVLAKDRGTILGDPIGSDFQGTGAGEALLGDHEPGIAGSAKQAGGRVE